MANDAIKVLDHGFIRLVDHMGSDLSIVRAARVSYDAAWRAGENTGSDARLINRLWADKHTSPFEAAEFQFEVFAPIFVFRQWHRHRTWAFNELSGRYRELPEVFYVPDPAAVGEQSSTNKQGRQETSASIIARENEVRGYRQRCEEAFATYRSLLACGWPRELARAVLPVSTYSHMFAKVDLRNLLHFLDLRLDPHAQKEIRVYAEAIVEIIRPIVPVAVSAWENSRLEPRP
jgi:thymidylate synthase (FAD)